mgnify:CR=1 FL=1
MVDRASGTASGDLVLAGLTLFDVPAHADTARRALDHGAPGRREQRGEVLIVDVDQALSKLEARSLQLQGELDERGLTFQPHFLSLPSGGQPLIASSSGSLKAWTPTRAQSGRWRALVAAPIWAVVRRARPASARVAPLGMPNVV